MLSKDVNNNLNQATELIKNSSHTTAFTDVIITQNIDNLHQQAGSKEVIEFHGISQRLVCTNCGKQFEVTEELLNILPHKCVKCSSILKPDIFFEGKATEIMKNLLHIAKEIIS